MWTCRSSISIEVFWFYIFTFDKSKKKTSLKTAADRSINSSIIWCCDSWTDLGCKWITQMCLCWCCHCAAEPCVSTKLWNDKQVLTSTSLLTFSMNFSFCSSVTYTFCMLFLKSMSLKVGSSFPYRNQTHFQRLSWDNDETPSYKMDRRRDGSFTLSLSLASRSTREPCKNKQK